MSINKIYYLPYTHWIYLNEIVRYYDKITLLAPVLVKDGLEDDSMLPISELGNIDVYALPYSSGYISAIPKIRAYMQAYRNLVGYDYVYLRYPVPFGWLSKLYLKSTKRIIHFVGDPIDAAINNPNFSAIKKKALVSFFMPEHLAYMWACRGARVYTNGFHLKNKLSKYGVDASALISSTLNKHDFYFEAHKAIVEESPKLLYVGYLRKAKGVETIVKALKKVHATYPTATLTIVGKGEFETDLINLTKQLGLSDFVNFAGHVDNRDSLNKIFRSHDIFCFASLSEGSPRVVLEAMANGINVLSTPVGALPSTFSDYKEIIYANYNDEVSFADKIQSLISDQELFNAIRFNAFNKVKDYTIEKFLKTIFNDN
ncbi:glycosyltransferase [Pontibacter sp. HSC-36F09]|uniref:glycosyltransferase family 4 protein n=1 Tax=Pontibacter sp. HSC-36F09 TaxID=2910966 RepID=UPI00209FE816|nr:glycosyltransferase involved in cell wall biosynthesis [Pontibacter sp. HSC-36F09]